MAAAEARAALPWHKRGPEPAPVEASPHLAPVLTNSLGWGAFMAVSANMRYQLINGFEDRVLVRPCNHPPPASPVMGMRDWHFRSGLDVVR